MGKDENNMKEENLILKQLCLYVFQKLNLCKTGKIFMKFNKIPSKARGTCNLVSLLAACKMLQKQLIASIKCISALVLFYERNS